ncbi:histidine phosphatase family protein [Mesobacillus zeae]|uniref:Histidine phosphatase family protein n=1 Tax=Mesobacillus zeae TaxID=1917180 RepID=A0A398BDA3_9BACI|nr:histidine phosphatase family protein [Mesobacillus zeae]RID85740.1 histidine phosphatase family protein [Mesobacillus zeae]
MDDTVAIALYRHGLTEENRRRAYLGWTDSPLCDEKLSTVPCSYDMLFSSDSGRCLKTAEILFPGRKPDRLSELRESHFGVWEGKTYEDLKDIAEYRRWLDNPQTAKPPGGESFTEFTERVERGWKRLIDRVLMAEAESAAVVTHGGVIRFLLTRYAPSEKDFWEWKVNHGQGYELVWQRAGLRRGERCILLREAALTEKENG